MTQPSTIAVVQLKEEVVVSHDNDRLVQVSSHVTIIHPDKCWARCSPSDLQADAPGISVHTDQANAVLAGR